MRARAPTERTRPKVVLLAADDRPSRVVASQLAAEFVLVAVIVETGRSRWRQVVRRVARLGLAHVIDQLAFQGLIRPLLRWRARRRTTQLLGDRRLAAAEFPIDRTTTVATVNDSTVPQLIAQAEPDVIVVHGTSILSRVTLAAIDLPILNMHAGMTPDYRGVHGAYWALAERRPHRCGVTVHLVDAGIDTGPVLAQTEIEPAEHDNFVTYPLLQLATGLPLLCDSIRSVARGEASPVRPSSPEPRSKLHSHPRATEYVWRRWQHGVR